MTRVVRFHEAGAAEVLRVEDLVVRPPGPGEVRLRVQAFGLNRADATYLSGMHPIQPDLPSLIGIEAAGVVESVGPGVEGFTIGETVTVIPRLAPEYGTFAELANVPARYITRHPANLSIVEAAGLWATYLTAYGGLIDAGELKAGQHILITAASSGVALAAIEIANMIGAIPIATTRDDSKVARIAAAGARAVIATDRADWTDAVLAATGGAGVEVIFDAVLGPAIEPTAMLATRGGIYVVYGVMVRDKPTPFPIGAAFARQLTIRTSVLDAKNDDQAPAMAAIAQGVADGRLRPIVDRVFPLEQIADAFTYLQSNRHFGKIVVTI